MHGINNKYDCLCTGKDNPQCCENRTVSKGDAASRLEAIRLEFNRRIDLLVEEMKR